MNNPTSVLRDLEEAQRAWSYSNHGRRMHVSGDWVVVMSKEDFEVAYGEAKRKSEWMQTFPSDAPPSLFGFRCLIAPSNQPRATRFEFGCIT